MKFAVAALTVLSLSSQLAVAQGIEPALRAGLSFGGPAKESRFEAHLLFQSRQSELPDFSTASRSSPYSIKYFSFTASQSQGQTLSLLGSPVVRWGYVDPQQAGLDQNGQKTKESSSWFGRNWWWVTGLGVLVVGAAAAAGGGGSSSNNSGSGGVGCTGNSCAVPCDATNPLNMCPT